MAKVEITGAGVEAMVTADGELLTSVSTYPALRQQKIYPFRQYFTDDGTSTGSSDLNVDGSVTPAEFYIPADPVDDRYITAVSFILGYGSSGQPNLWGDNVALTNGVEFLYTSLKGEIQIHDGMKQTENMWRMNFDYIGTSWEIRHLGASNDYGTLVPVDLTRIIPPYGIKLDAGTTQRLILRVRDVMPVDVTDTFNCISYGFNRFA